MNNPTKVTVIGGGVGGYPAAIRAARRGAQVTLVEKGLLGGVCLNWGCIPTKSLLQSGQIVQTIRDAGRFGISCKEYKINFRDVMRRKNSVVGQLRQGVEKLLAAKKIRVIKGTGSLVDASTVHVAETDEKVPSDKIILATGSRPIKLPIPGGSEDSIWDSDQFLDMKRLPKSVAIVGGGFIGVEFAQILHRLGAKVTILEMMETLVPTMDKEIALALQQRIVEEGIQVLTQAGVKKLERSDTTHKVTYTTGDETKTSHVDQVVVSVGRRPDLSALHLDRVGLAHTKNGITVNEHMGTNIPGIYAVGDAVGGIMLAHVATAEGECAAVNATGERRAMNYRAVPSCIYTSPEVASVGRSEEEARKQYDVQVGRFPFHGCGKALVLNETYGMVKIVSEKKYGEVLGVHIIGPHATDLIAEAVLGMTMEMTVDELAHAIHPHPTLSEAIMESALSLSGGAVHMP